MCWEEFLRLKLVFRFLNVTINICCCYAGFNSFVVFYYTWCISVLTDSTLDSRPSTSNFRLSISSSLIFGNRLSVQERNEYLHGSSWYSNFCRVQVMTRTIDSSVAYFLKLQSSLLSLPIREFKKLRLLLQQKRHFKIKLCFRLTVPRLFHVDHVVQNRRGALSLAWHQWFPRKSKEWKIYCCGLALSPEPPIGSLKCIWHEIFY